MIKTVTSYSTEECKGLIPYCFISYYFRWKLFQIHREIDVCSYHVDPIFLARPVRFVELVRRNIDHRGQMAMIRTRRKKEQRWYDTASSHPSQHFSIKLCLSLKRHFTVTLRTTRTRLLSSPFRLSCILKIAHSPLFVKILLGPDRIIFHYQQRHKKKEK